MCQEDKSWEIAWSIIWLFFVKNIARCNCWMLRSDFTIASKHMTLQRSCIDTIPPTPIVSISTIARRRTISTSFSGWKLNRQRTTTSVNWLEKSAVTFSRAWEYSYQYVVSSSIFLTRRRSINLDFSRRVSSFVVLVDTLWTNVLNSSKRVHIVNVPEVQCSLQLHSDSEF